MVQVPSKKCPPTLTDGSLMAVYTLIFLSEPPCLACLWGEMCLVMWSPHKQCPGQQMWRPAFQSKGSRFSELLPSLTQALGGCLASMPWSSSELVWARHSTCTAAFWLVWLFHALTKEPFLRGTAQFSMTKHVLGTVVLLWYQWLMNGYFHV